MRFGFVGFVGVVMAFLCSLVLQPPLYHSGAASNAGVTPVRFFGDCGIGSMDLTALTVYSPWCEFGRTVALMISCPRSTATGWLQ